FFAQPVVAAPPIPAGNRLEPWVVLAFVLAAGGHGGLLYAISKLSTPMPVPEPLELLSDRSIRDELVVLHDPEEPEKPPATGDDGSGTGVKDPGIHDKKDQGGGRKIAGDMGKLGQKDHQGETKLT